MSSVFDDNVLLLAPGGQQGPLKYSLRLPTCLLTVFCYRAFDLFLQCSATEHPMHSEIFLRHPNLLIQAHLRGEKQEEIVANFFLSLPKLLNPQKFWGPLPSDRKFFATNSCETYILHAMLCGIIFTGRT
jgi:hypothetical protein